VSSKPHQFNAPEQGERVTARLKAAIALAAGVLVVALLASLSGSATNASSVPSASLGFPIFVGGSGNEPIIITAPDGTLYISALQHLYRSTDSGEYWTKLVGPPLASTLTLASDSSIAADPGGRLYFTFDYPYAGTTAVCTSDDRGNTWSCNPLVAPGVTDRMWVLAPSTSAAYLVTNQGLYQTLFLTSIDRGLTWVPSRVGNGLFEPQTGPLLQKPGSPQVLQIIKGSGGLSLYVYSLSVTGAALSDRRPVGLPNPLALPSASFTSDGALYVASESQSASGGRQVVLARTTNEGVNWTQLPPIPHTTSGTATFSAVAAGSPGHVGVLYYYTPTAGDPGTMGDEVVWSAVWAESYNANTASPRWKITTVEQTVHAGLICIASNCTGAGRFAGDFISAVIDSNDKAHLTWMADAIHYQRILPNRAPLASLVARPTSGSAPLAVTFDGTGSRDPDDNDRIVRYSFDFGDGTAVTKPDATASHSYSRAGTYTARLTVEDEVGAKTTSTPVTINVTTPPAHISSLVLTPTTLLGGCQTSSGTVTLTAKAPPGGALVRLTNTNRGATVPPSVSVAAGATSAIFKVTTLAVASAQSGAATASYNGTSRSAIFKVRPAGVLSLQLTPNPVTGPTNVTGVVKLECHAPDGGVTVNLSSNNPSVANPVLGSIIIPKGASSKSFTVRTANVSSARSAAIKATANGISKSVVLTVN
jgi:PKD repeat protein